MNRMQSVRIRMIALIALAVVAAVFLIPVSQGVAEHHEGSLASF